MSIENHVIHLENGVLHSDTPRSRVDNIVRNAVDAGNPSTIVVHFHGGLVSYNNGMKTAERLKPVYEQAGSYPVFFVWESGLLETIANNLQSISEEKFFQIVWKRIRKIIERKLAKSMGARTTIALPPADNEDELDRRIDEFIDNRELDLLLEDAVDESQLSELTPTEMSMLESELAFDIDLTTEIAKISNALRDEEDVEEEIISRNSSVQGSSATLMDPAALDRYVDGRGPQSRGIISTARLVKAIIVVAGRVIGRFLSGRDHGLHATIVEEILHEFYLANAGGIIWKHMKQDTADSFGGDVHAHGGSAFLDALNNTIDFDNPPRIVLVGHSTGAVYISHFLAAADAALPGSVKFDVVLLAPASTFRLTEKTVSQFHGRIGGFRIYTMDDDHEKGDRLVPILYPHSLLYFVSGVVETETDMPLVGMERYFDRSNYRQSAFPKVETVRAYTDSINDSIVWSVATGNPAGMNSTAKKHGDFTRDVPTMESVSHVISNGF